jgi:hypothetical protein
VAYLKIFSLFYLTTSNEIFLNPLIIEPSKSRKEGPDGVSVLKFLIYLFLGSMIIKYKHPAGVFIF